MCTLSQNACLVLPVKSHESCVNVTCKRLGKIEKKYEKAQCKPVIILNIKPWKFVL